MTTKAERQLPAAAAAELKLPAIFIHMQSEKAQHFPVHV